MTELQPYKKTISWESKHAGGGRLTVLTATGDHTGFAHRQSVSNGTGTLVSFYAYNRRGTYDVLYAVLDAGGNMESLLHEQEGILPTLFHAPGGALWVSVSPYHPDKELETFLPVFGRAAAEPLKPGRPFPGDFTGCIGDTAVFWNDDLFSDNKPDTLQLLQFSNGAIVRKSNVKIPLPKSNKLLIADGKVELVCYDDEALLHRSMDISGNILQQRLISFYPLAFQALSLGFGKTSSLFYAGEDGVFGICDISPDGAVQAHPLLHTRLDVYSTWPVLWLNDDTFVLRFTHDTGNGWAVISNRQVAECYVQDATDGVYTDLVSNRSIVLGNEAMILSDACRLGADHYALTFYPQDDDDDNDDDDDAAKGAGRLLVLQRHVGE